MHAVRGRLHIPRPLTCPNLYQALESGRVYFPPFFSRSPRLLNPEGSLMAFAGKCDKKENITAAVAANIWMSNAKSAKSAFQDEGLQYIVMDCEVGIIHRHTV